MSTMLGADQWTYQELDEWEQLPTGWSFFEVADVAVDADDRVYVCSRGEHPILVFEADGRFVTAFGEGQFTRAHGVTIGPDGLVYCADDSGHCIRKYTRDGQRLDTLGTPDRPSPRFSGQPLNLPTKVAFDPATDACYVADGYGNARVHKYAASGEHLLSWGAFGCDPGQFNLVHSVCTDDQGRVYVADRENHRVQVFDGEGNYLDQWNDMHRPCGLCIRDGLAYVGQLPTHLGVNADYPNIGACVSVHDLQGHRLVRLGDIHVGEGPGQFTSPHGVAVDSTGAIYVAEVSWTAYGGRFDPPRAARSFRKLVRQPGGIT